MENSNSFDLNPAIQQWRENLAQSSAFRGENLNELESHLRDSIATLQACGLSTEEAFLSATRRVGKGDALEMEFAKVNAGTVWRVRVFWMLAGMLVFALGADLAAVASGTFMLAGSWMGINGLALGWMGVAGQCTIFLLIAGLFGYAALGKLKQTHSAITHLFAHPMLTVVILLSAAVAMKLAGAGLTSLLARQLTVPMLVESYLILFSFSHAGPFLVMAVLAVAFTRFLTRHRTRSEERRVGKECR